MKQKQNKTHWLSNPNKNYFGHWDLPANGEITLTIKSAGWEEVKNPVTGKNKACRVVRFQEDAKPLIANQTNSQSIINATGVNWMEDSGGHKITLFLSTVKDRKSGSMIDCVRIKNETIVINLPELNPTHDRWLGAKNAIGTGNVTLAQIKKRFSITAQNEALLCSK